MMVDSQASAVSVLIHPSQFPDAVEASMKDSLSTRKMNHKFHYDTPKQTLRWLRLHEALSPARIDPDCLRIYDSAFGHCISSLKGAGQVEVVSLGCGGGQKDAQLLQLLAAELPGVKLRYVPVDVSSGLALVARQVAMDVGLKSEEIIPVVLDLASVGDWSAALASALGHSDRRIVCFFGMMPNFRPVAVLPQLARLIRPSDILLVSANLAPGTDYAKGVDQVLPLYDNRLTRDWLWAVFQDLGIDSDSGRMDFSIVGCPDGGDLLRIESNITFLKECHIRFGGAIYTYAPGDCFQLFFSYRHTPSLLSGLLARNGMSVDQHWSNGSGEEGVFACVQGRSCIR